MHAFIAILPEAIGLLKIDVCESIAVQPNYSNLVSSCKLTVLILMLHLMFKRQ